MLGLSSGLGLLPFFPPPGRYYISGAPLYLAVPFSTSEFSFPLFFRHLSKASSSCFGVFLTSPMVHLHSRNTRSLMQVFLVFPSSAHSSFLSFLSQTKRSQAVCPDPSVPANALAWRRWCGAVTSTFTRCPKASPGT